jgi:hypothetical protein
MLGVAHDLLDPTNNTVGSALARANPEDLEHCPSNCPITSNGSPPSGPDGGCFSGQAVLDRAAIWLTAWDGGPVPYSSSADAQSWFDGYRRDCSGYTSMALGLSGPGMTTTALAAASTPIAEADLRPGDLLINPATGGAGHVVIFDHWADDAMSSYVGYEQSADGGTHHRTIPYPYFGDYAMSPFQGR